MMAFTIPEKQYPFVLFCFKTLFFQCDGRDLNPGYQIGNLMS